MPYTHAFDQLFTLFALIAVAIYLARTLLGVALLIVGAIPSRIGAKARAAGTRITPRLVMRIVSAVTGMLIAATGIGASAALAAPSPSATASSHVTENHALDEDDELMVIDRGPTPMSGTTGISKANTSKPTSSSPTSMVSPQTAPSAVATASEVAEPAPRRNTPPKPRSTVIVKQGDTLWSIAASQLDVKPTDRQIDREWRRWYRANKQVIGSNPDVIVPGMKLEAPTS